MKKIMLIVIGMLLLTTFNAQGIKKTRLEDNRLKGRVEKQLLENWWVTEEFGEIKKTAGNNAVVSYDANGSIIEIASSWSVFEGISNKIIYKYDANGNNIEDEAYLDWYGKEFLRYKNLYKYDANENIVENVQYDAQGILCNRTIYKYNVNGNVVESVASIADGSLGSKTLYKYNAQGNRVEYTRYNAKGSLEDKRTYKYDTMGNIAEYTNYKITLQYEGIELPRVPVSNTKGTTGARLWWEFWHLSKLWY